MHTCIYSKVPFATASAEHILQNFLGARWADATIVSDADDYAEKVRREMVRAGIRVETDLRNEKINYKVREHSVAKVPVILVAGKREVEEGTLNVRRLGSQTQQSMKLEEVIRLLSEEATPPDVRRERAV